MKIANPILLGILVVLSLGCSSRQKEGNSQQVQDIVSASALEADSPFATFPERELPLVDSTNFDNLTNTATLPLTEVEKLQLTELDFAGSGLFSVNYRLKLVNGFQSLVVTYFASDVEMYTYLVNYDSGFRRIDELPIAYDEIAESYLRKYARVTDAQTIVVISQNSATGELVQTETKFKCLNDGTFEPAK
jgi:hypothetical protein